MSTKKEFRVGLLIFLSFLLTSGEYMTWWMNSLVPNFSPNAADFLSEGLGYLFQVIGLLLMAVYISKNTINLKPRNRFFWLLILFDFLASILACIFSSNIFILVFGFTMNFFHGCIAGWYLMVLSKEVSSKSLGLTFGLSYAIASLAYYALSQIASLFENTTIIFVFYFVIAILIVLSNEYIAKSPLSSGATPEYNPEPSDTYEAPALTKKIISIALFLVVMVSFTRGLGFYFPSSDTLLNGVDPILTRCFYAIGLILAGIIDDYFRRYGGILCIISLVFPFIVLALINAPNSETLFWIIGYIFFGFLAVYRVTMLQEMSQRASNYLWLSVMGLAMGRIGDAFSVFVGILCNNHHITLVIISLVCFTVSLILFFRLYSQYYITTKVITKEIIVEKPANDTNTSQQLAKELQLSDRESEVLYLLLAKKTNAEIAYELHISENTVKFHVKNILKKAGCENRKQLFEKI